jgi:mannose-1-phosphate guanylyltransferase
MKAFLLAAGHGTRLRPITNTVPKCLVPICGVPMLHIWLQICRRYGIDEVLINLHAHADVVRTATAGWQCGVKVQVSEEAVLLGSAGTVRAHRDWVAGEPCFWILYADVLTNTNLNQMLKAHRDRPMAATIGLYRVAEPSRCGVVSFDDDCLVREFVEKPEKPKSDWAFSGLMLATRELIDAIPTRTPADLGFDVLPTLVGRMLAHPMADYLIDIGTLENYQLAQTTWPGFNWHSVEANA